MTRALFPRRRPKLRLIDRFHGEADDLLRSLFDADGEGRMVCDSDGRIVRVNARLAALAGADVALAPGAPAAGLFAPERRAPSWQALFFVLSGKPPRRFASLLAGSGAAVVELQPQPLVESDGTISGLIVAVTDISAQRHLEAQLAQSQKLQAVGQLAGGIAHDFNNLLTAVMGAAEEVAGRPETDPETRDAMAQITASAERGAALVRQLLAFSRQQTLQPRVVEINRAIGDVSRLLRRLLGSKVRLSLELEEPGRRVRVDPVQLDQVLINLAVNARDAMGGASASGGQGGIVEASGELRLRTGHALLLRPKVIGSETIPPGRYVVISVEDSGAGIAADILPRVFDPFFTTKRERGGNGLGLSTVHGIVRQSEGFLSVESELGKGTRFSIYLPRYEGEAEPEMAAAPAPGPAHPAAARRTVLIVEDEDEVRRLAARVFAQHGWEVLSAEDGDAAHSLLMGTADRRLDLVVSDVVMPGLDGPALVKSLREVRPGLPAILVSGYADEALRRELARQDIVFMPKPYSLRGLVETAETALS